MYTTNNPSDSVYNRLLPVFNIVPQQFFYESQPNHPTKGYLLSAIGEGVPDSFPMGSILAGSIVSSPDKQGKIGFVAPVTGSVAGMPSQRLLINSKSNTTPDASYTLDFFRDSTSTVPALGLQVTKGVHGNSDLPLNTQNSVSLLVGPDSLSIEPSLFPPDGPPGPEVEESAPVPILDIAQKVVPVAASIGLQTYMELNSAEMAKSSDLNEAAQPAGFLTGLGSIAKVAAQVAMSLL